MRITFGFAFVSMATFILAAALPAFLTVIR